ncbi:unnamed protein product [Urochloa humidicola]
MTASSPPSLSRARGALPLIGHLHQLGAVPHDSLAALAARHAAPRMLLPPSAWSPCPQLVVSPPPTRRAPRSSPTTAPCRGAPRWARTPGSPAACSLQDIVAEAVGVELPRGRRRVQREKLIDHRLNKKLLDSIRLHGDPAYNSTINSRDQIKGMLTDMFIAGTDTAAARVE